MTFNHIEAIAAPVLETAAQHCRAEYPDDAEVIDRLFAYLKVARPTTTEIKEVVMDFYMVEPDEIEMRKHRCRLPAYSFARHMYCYLCRRYTRASVITIARRIGFDHSCVSYGVQKIAGLVQSRPIVRDDVDLLNLKLAEKIMRRPLKGNGSC